jgi:Glycosyltransferase family 87
VTTQSGGRAGWDDHVSVPGVAYAANVHGTGSSFDGRDLRRCRSLVIVVALAMLVPKLILAATTFGTNDIGHWFDFLSQVERVGPIGVYGVPFTHSLYNHPPLIGYFLELIGAGTHVGLAANFSIRAVASVADVATAVLVFELLRTRRGLRKATFAGVVVACSPILLIISGYHGNTDPIFIMLVFLSVYLLVDRKAPILAGAALALALGVKIVPVVVIPCLLIYGFQRGRSTLFRFAGGFAAVSALFWVPALLQQWGAIRRNVLGYSGSPAHDWGLAQLGQMAGNPTWATWLEGPGRMLVVATCAVIPALLVWRRPDCVVYGVAFALAGFLALTPTFGTQYLVWGAAALVLLSPMSGLAFNLLAGALLAEVYTRWNGGLPWDRARASIFTSGEQVFALLVWAVLVWALIEAARRLPAAHHAPARAEPGHRTSQEHRARFAPKFDRRLEANESAASPD